MRVLIADAQDSVARALELRMTSEGMRPFVTDVGEDAVDLALRYDYDIVVLDDALPDMPGLACLRAMRRAGVTTPVLILSYESKVAAKVEALNAGADHYMTKPFHVDEAMAWVKAIVRRSHGLAEAKIEIGDVTVHTDRKVAEVKGHRVHMTGKEFMILELLATRRGQCVTKQAIMDHLYGDMDEPDIKIVDVFACKLRRKIRLAGGDPDVIGTVWGRGYSMGSAQAEKVAA